MTPIPGTRVEDNALHRASLWLEDFKRTRDGYVQQITNEQMGVELAEFAQMCGVEIEGDALVEGADYYAENFRQMIFGPRLGMTVVTPGGPINLVSILRSVWIDGMQHGAAMTAGKRGLSTQEIAEGVDRE